MKFINVSIVPPETQVTHRIRCKIFTLLLAIMFSTCFGQELTEYIGHSTLRNRVKNDTLIDKELKMIFVLDTAHINITAYDFAGKPVWKTDPWLGNKLREYRVKRPVVVSYSFQKNKWTDEKEVIWITYNNTQFGILDKNTGKFTWFGQD